MMHDTTDQRARRARLAFTVLALVQSTLIFTITMIGVPLPDIGREFGLSTSKLLLLSVSYGLPFSSLLLFGGRLADRYGGRRMFVIGVLVFGLTSVLAAFAPTYEVLVAMRFSQGVGGAMIAPAAMAVLRVLFPQPTEFGRAMASWGGVSVLGSVMGFLVAGPVTTLVSWRWLFAVPIGVALLALGMTRSLIPTQLAERRPDRPALDLVGAVLATLGISLTSYGLIASGDYPEVSARVLVPQVLGIALFGAFLVFEQRARDPLLPPRFVADPCRAAGLAGMFLSAAAAGGLISFVLSLYLQQVRHWSPLATAGAFLPFAIALIATGRFAVPLVARYGPSRITIAGLIIAGHGLGLLAGLKYDSTYVSGLLPGLVLLAMGSSLVFSGSAVLATANVPQHQAGLAGGVMNMAMELGPTVGLASLMSVAAAREDIVDGYVWAFGTASITFIIAALAILPLTGRAACAPQHP